MAEPASGKAHTLLKSRKHTLAFYVVSNQNHFPEPGWRRGNGLGRGLDVDGKIGVTTQWASLSAGNVLFCLFKEGWTGKRSASHASPALLKEA
jgi:hypothetical protein